MRAYQPNSLLLQTGSILGQCYTESIADINTITLQLSGSGTYVQTDGMGTTLENYSWSASSPTFSWARQGYLLPAVLGAFSLSTLCCSGGVPCPCSIGLLAIILDSASGQPGNPVGPYGTLTESVGGSTGDVFMDVGASLGNFGPSGCAADAALSVTFTGNPYGIDEFGGSFFMPGDPGGRPITVSFPPSCDRTGTYNGTQTYNYTSPDGTITSTFSLSWILTLG